MGKNPSSNPISETSSDKVKVASKTSKSNKRSSKDSKLKVRISRNKTCTFKGKKLYLENVLTESIGSNNTTYRHTEVVIDLGPIDNHMFSAIKKAVNTVVSFQNGKPTERLQEQEIFSLLKTVLPQNEEPSPELSGSKEESHVEEHDASSEVAVSYVNSDS